MNNAFAKWTPINANYVDPEALRMSCFVQSSATRDGRVPEFQLHSVSTGEGKTRIKVTVPDPLPVA